ncbi:MAG: hypothetical protein LAT68_02805 [Cyclobacteriaceae bacterium]|nr:hypothetical protein [Cyclobacteriaceae bacterium]MCH8515235.1 hypothetical protein [Cyclobacteriaceae bacterium]
MNFEYSSVPKIRKLLKDKSQEELQEIVINLASFQADNKDLISFHLSEKFFPEEFLEDFEEWIALEFNDAMEYHFYGMKKKLMKIKKRYKKILKLVKDKPLNFRIRLMFCQKVVEEGLWDEIRYSSLQNYWLTEVKSLESAYEKLHEDIRFDYQMDMEEIEEAKIGLS